MKKAVEDQDKCGIQLKIKGLQMPLVFWLRRPDNWEFLHRLAPGIKQMYN